VSVDPSVIALGSIVVAILATIASAISPIAATMVGKGHERAQAREERQQRRLEATYAETAEYLLRIRDFAVRTVPMMQTSTDPAPPEFPPEDEQRRAEAQLVLHGSPEVLADLETLTQHIAAFRAKVWLLHETRKPGSALAPSEVTNWVDVDKSRQTVLIAVRELSARMNNELRERRPH
jgi:hypothetical protein